MGSSASKAAQNSVRRFPSRAGSLSSPPPAAAPKRQQAPTTRKSAATGASTAKDDAIRLDGADPSPPLSDVFAARLRQIGAVQPNPTLSYSSTASHGPVSPDATRRPSPAQNTTLSVLEARQRLQDKADLEIAEMGSPGFPGRELVGATVIRDMLVLRSRGLAAAEIESRLGLKSGTVGHLGPPGLVDVLGGR